jgi:sulfur-oxidizing protein SoxZ
MEDRLPPIPGRLKVPAQAERGVPFDVRVLIQHPMETGYRVDSVGHKIPRNIVREFVCRAGDAELFRAEFGPGVGANPYLHFLLQLDRSAELSFEWTDDRGARGEHRAMVEVRG